jgi:micrococcal nuclease
LVIASLCLVVAIVDGDTLKVRCSDQPMAVVRLAEVDAPEKAQAFGERSRQHLAELCFQQRVEVKRQAVDRYGRTVARVTCAGQDASAEQVRAGMAWAFPKYLTDKSIAGVETEARAQHRGLWADAAPVAPWEWRRIRAR